ncbi:phosphatase PAP2 family protein [Cryptosporangium aurantiacum]|nr:phosphatase PAP2 family protein [Cryptosporangium aurantiacum]
MGQSEQQVIERSTTGQPSADRRLLTRLLLALVAACAAAVPVALLAIVVKNVDWPVARLDLSIARGLNEYAADNPWFVDVLDWISTVGHPASFRIGATVAALWLLAVDRPRLALWTLVTTWGGALLGVLLKLLVARARPVLPEAVAHADGYSFPSGHALGAFVGCAVLLLLWLDAERPERKAIPWVVACLGTVAVCFSRLGLGVHYFSDVVGGCVVGLGWVAATTIVFQVWRRESGLPAADVVNTGIEPERAEKDVDNRPLPRWRAAPAEIARALPRLVPFWIGLVVVTAGVGWLVTKVFGESVLGDVDRELPVWFSDHRTTTLDDLTAFGTLLGETTTITIVTAVAFFFARLLYRRWLEPVVILLAVVGEVWGFVLVAWLVDRSRPPVPQLDIAPPTSSYPSGHTAATVACYGVLAVLAARRTRVPRPWLFAGVALAAVVIGVCRIYRGMHHPTDVVAGAAYGAVWLTIVVVVLLRKSPQPEGFTVRKVST